MQICRGIGWGTGGCFCLYLRTKRRESTDCCRRGWSLRGFRANTCIATGRETAGFKHFLLRRQSNESQARDGCGDGCGCGGLRNGDEQRESAVERSSGRGECGRAEES